MGKEILKPVAKTLIVLATIGMFSCKSPMKENIHGANMGEKPPATVEVKKDAHQEEVLKATPQAVKKPSQVPKKVKLEGETIDNIVGPGEKLPYKGSR